MKFYYLTLLLDQEVGEEDELVDGEALGAFGQEGFDGGEDVGGNGGWDGGQEGRQRVAQGLASHGEGLLHYLLEVDGVAAEVGAVVARQPQYAAAHLGRGREYERLDGEQVFAVVPGLQQHGEDAAVAVARRGADAFGHFLLQHPGGNGYAVAVLQDLEKYLTRDVVREIAYQRHFLTRKYRVEVHLQEVGLHHVQVRVQVVQESDAFGIQFHAFQRSPGVHQVFGQDAHAGSDLKDGEVAPRAGVFRQLPGRNGVGYARGDVLVVQEMLS